MLSRRFAGYIKTRATLRKEQVREEIRQIVAVLKSEGIYPSGERVIARVTASKNIYEINSILYELKRDLAIS
jgi:hypothetical protein